MALNFPDAGENLVLDMIVNKTAAQNLILKLFKSNTTPAESDTAATYTEADFSGYAAITLTGASWNAASSGSNSYAQQTFTCNGGGVSNSIYGYYVVQASSGILLYSERDASAPFTLTNNGDNIKLTPAISAN